MKRHSFYYQLRHKYPGECSEEYSEEHSHQMILTPEEHLNTPRAFEESTVSMEVDRYVTIRNLYMIEENGVEICKTAHARHFANNYAKKNDFDGN